MEASTVPSASRAHPRAARLRGGDARLRGARDIRRCPRTTTTPTRWRPRWPSWAGTGIQIPEEYGGSGGSFLDACLFLEETARGQIPVGAYGVTLICVGALNRFGTEGQKQDLLGRVSRGGTLAIAMSEPDSGRTWHR